GLDAAHPAPSSAWDVVARPRCRAGAAAVGGVPRTSGLRGTRCGPRTQGRRSGGRAQQPAAPVQVPREPRAATEFPRDGGQRRDHRVTFQDHSRSLVRQLPGGFVTLTHAPGAQTGALETNTDALLAVPASAPSALVNPD